MFDWTAFESIWVTFVYFVGIMCGMAFERVLDRDADEEDMEKINKNRIWRIWNKGVECLYKLVVS